MGFWFGVVFLKLCSGKLSFAELSKARHSWKQPPKYCTFSRCNSNLGFRPTTYFPWCVLPSHTFFRCEPNPKCFKAFVFFILLIYYTLRNVLGKHLKSENPSISCWEMMIRRIPLSVHGFDIKSKPFQEWKESAFGVSAIMQKMNVFPFVPFPPFA